MIDEFVNNFHKKTTQKTYRSHLKSFFRFLQVDPKKYFSTNRNYEQDVIQFSKYLWDRPPGSQQVILSTVRIFLSEYDVDIKEKIWRNIRNRRGGSKTVSIECIPNNSDIKKILQYGDVKARALFLLMSSSGMRLDEALGLKMSNIDFEKKWIYIPYNIAKNGRKRETGFTQEAKEVLDEWLKYRPKFFINGYRKSKFLRKKYEKNGISTKNVSDRWVFVKDGIELRDSQLDDRLFPFSDSCARKIWDNLLEKAGPPYNDKDEQECLCFPRYKYHIHTLRKFWFTELLNSGANESHLNVMGGHDSSLDRRYIRPSTSVLKKTYEEHCECIEIYSERWRIQKEIKPKLKNQEIAISSLLISNRDFESEIEKLQRDIDILHGAMNIVLSMREEEEIKRDYEVQDKVTKELAIKEISRNYTKKQFEEDKELLKKNKEIFEDLKNLYHEINEPFQMFDGNQPKTNEQK